VLKSRNIDKNKINILYYNLNIYTCKFNSKDIIKINKMGTYLSEPKKEKKTEIGSNGKFEFSSTCMQGWRTNMEDAHIA
jgi:hypothetical protein